MKTSNKKGIYYHKSSISFLFFVSRSKTLKDSVDVIAYITSSRIRPIRRPKYIQYKSLFAKCFPLILIHFNNNMTVTFF